MFAQKRVSDISEEEVPTLQACPVAVPGVLLPVLLAQQLDKGIPYPAGLFRMKDHGVPRW